MVVTGIPINESGLTQKVVQEKLLENEQICKSKLNCIESYKKNLNFEKLDLGS